MYRYMYIYIYIHIGLRVNPAAWRARLRQARLPAPPHLLYTRHDAAGS